MFVAGPTSDVNILALAADQWDHYNAPALSLNPLRASLASGDGGLHDHDQRGNN